MSPWAWVIFQTLFSPQAEVRLRSFSCSIASDVTDARRGSIEFVASMNAVSIPPDPESEFVGSLHASLDNAASHVCQLLRSPQVSIADIDSRSQSV